MACLRHPSLYAILFLTLVGVDINATPIWLHDAIVKQTPDDLGYWVFTGSDCPFSNEDVERLVDGVWVRSRLRSSDSYLFELHLQITVLCLDRGEANPIFNHDVFFVPARPDTFNEFLTTTRYVLDYNFGTFGVGPSEYILQSVKESVEEAVTEYLRANFDL